ncbi:MAG: sulfatase-like hydrolase/transferase [Planctomycetota bacterium]
MKPEHPCLTPNIDKLASEGLRLHRFYSTNPACCPARATIMTGTYPSKHHINGFVHKPGEKRLKGDQRKHDYIDEV